MEEYFLCGAHTHKTTNKTKEYKKEQKKESKKGAERDHLHTYTQKCLLFPTRHLTKRRVGSSDAVFVGRSLTKEE